MIMAMGLFNSHNAFSYFWPSELALIAGGLFYTMKPSKNIWLTVPATISFGLSVMFAYSTIFSAWDDWAYSWPLVIFLIMGVVWWTLKWAGRGQTTDQQASLVGHRFSLVAYGIVIVVAVVSLFLGRA
jgi:hypothetical protein